MGYCKTSRRIGSPARFFTVIIFMLVSSALLAIGIGGCQKTEVFGKDVLAVVNGEPITVEDFRAANGGEIPRKLDARQDVLSAVINNRLASRAALEKGMLGDPDVYSLLEEFYADRLPEYLRKKIASEVSVSDEELIPYKKDTPTIFDVSIIATNTLGEAQAALAELNKGANFKEVAAKLSMLKGQADREVRLDDALYPVGVRAVLNRLSPGALSPVMKMEMGYVVFKLNSRKGSEELWNAEKEGLRATIKQRKVEREMEELTARLRSSADIKYKKRFKIGEEQYIGADVNGENIGVEESMLNPAGDPHEPHAGLNVGTLKAALDKRIDGFLLSQEAKRRGVQYDLEFQKELRLKKEEALARVYMEKVKGTYDATPQEIKDYYEKNKDKYNLKARVRVSRILLLSREDAETVLGELKAGKDFAALAREKSADKATGAEGGDAGFVVPEMMKEPMKSAISGMKVGDTSGIIKSDYGYEILKATGREESSEPKMSEIAESIKKRVVLIKQSERVEAFYKSLHDKADIKINKKLLESLK